MADLGFKQNRDERFYKNLLTGGVSAVIAKTAAAPLERIKLLLQNQDASLQISADKKYKGMTDCLMRVVREQGFFSLWRGYLVTIIRYFPAQAVSFAMFDVFK